jgi:hypothetical protein
MSLDKAQFVSLEHDYSVWGNTRGDPAASGSLERGRFRAMLTHCRCPTVLFLEPNIIGSPCILYNIYFDGVRAFCTCVCMCVMCIWKRCARTVHICKSRYVHKHTRLCTHSCFRSVAGKRERVDINGNLTVTSISAGSELSNMCVYICICVCV